MTDDRRDQATPDMPARYRTPQRPGQSGEQAENRAGPNPRSTNPTGPHAPYEPADRDGLAAEKHWSETIPAVSGTPRAPKQSGTIQVMDGVRKRGA